MKKYLFFIVFITMSFVLKSQKNMVSCLEIDFQDFFLNDSVSLAINQYFIFANKILNSDFSSGITDMRVKIYRSKNESFVIIGNDSIMIGSMTDTIIINATLNGNENKYKIDIDKGKYIGLSKKCDDGFILYQSKEPFEYD